MTVSTKQCDATGCESWKSLLKWVRKRRNMNFSQNLHSKNKFFTFAFNRDMSFRIWASDWPRYTSIKHSSQWATSALELLNYDVTLYISCHNATFITCGWYHRRESALRKKVTDPLFKIKLLHHINLVTVVQLFLCFLWHYGELLSSEATITILNQTKWWVQNDLGLLIIALFILSSVSLYIYKIYITMNLSIRLNWNIMYSS